MRIPNSAPRKHPRPLASLWARVAALVLPDRALLLAWPHLDANDRRWLTHFQGGGRGWSL